MAMLLDHPLSEIFPLMRASEFSELVNDVKANGLRDPIVLLDGKILDGRNRYRACQELNIDPPCEAFGVGDPLRYVISKNLIRRHLRDGQRAMIAAELATKALGENQFKRSGALSQSEASQLLRVSEQSLHRAAVVRQHGIPELKEALRNGAVTVNAAKCVARLPENEQREIFSRGKRAIVAEARKARKPNTGSGRQQYATLWKCVDSICDALEQSRLDDAHSAASQLQDEIRRVAASRRAR